ncbi:ISNCY family transposase, partial [Bacillus sp. SIMBA_005]
GHSLPYRVFNKDQRVTHAAITGNKRLSDVLAYIKAQQDQPVAANVKTNSAKNGYKQRGGKPGRRTDFMNDPAVNARRQKALSRQHSSEQ